MVTWKFSPAALMPGTSRSPSTTTSTSPLTIRLLLLPSPMSMPVTSPRDAMTFPATVSLLPSPEMTTACRGVLKVSSATTASTVACSPIVKLWPPDRDSAGPSKSSLLRSRKLSPVDPRSRGLPTEAVSEMSKVVDAGAPELMLFAEPLFTAAMQAVRLASSTKSQTCAADCSVDTESAMADTPAARAKRRPLRVLDGGDEIASNFTGLICGLPHSLADGRCQSRRRLLPAWRHPCSGFLNHGQHSGSPGARSGSHAALLCAEVCPARPDAVELPRKGEGKWPRRCFRARSWARSKRTPSRGCRAHGVRSGSIPAAVFFFPRPKIHPPTFKEISIAECGAADLGRELGERATLGSVRRGLSAL